MGEPPSIIGGNFIENPRTGDMAVFSQYSKVFATTDRIMLKDRHNQAVRVYFPQPITHMIKPVPFEEKKLLVLAAGDKHVQHHRSGYAKRREWVEFCIKYRVRDFDIYGGYNWTTWSKGIPMYKGVVPLSQDYDPACNIARGLIDKIELIKNYKFYLCYENEIFTRGWVTEKIFECFVAGCVPVYWGASNVSLYIPKNCYIDRTSFKDDRELYNFIKNMPKNSYEEYLKNINAFLSSSRMSLYSIPYFLHCILSVIVPDYPMDVVFSQDEINIIQHGITEQKKIDAVLKPKKGCYE
jgi:hypothetical protein